MNAYTFHISLFGLLFFAMISVGMTFALLLAFVKTANRGANRFLALALAIMILWMLRVFGTEANLPSWGRLPMQFLLALGPLLYFYVLKITRPQYRFTRKDILHFSPLLVEQALLFFPRMDPVLRMVIFISNITYLHLSDKLIQQFYRGLQPVLMDRPLVEFRWLRRILAASGLLWCLWIACAGLHAYYPFYIFFAVMMIWTAAAAFLRPQAALTAQVPSPAKQPVPAELRAKGHLLKRAMETNLYYQDPELSLGSLAEKLKWPPHELSKVINTVFKKGFNDFINGYRIRDVATKMQDPAYAHMTLLGIAYEAGFNSQSSFNRIFKQLAGKTPLEYKNGLKKEQSTYNLGGRATFAGVISSYQATQGRAVLKLNHHFMFRNYVKIAWRNLAANKAFAFINITGLAVGLACCMLILLYTRDESSFDRFQEKGHQLYRVTCELVDRQNGRDEKFGEAGAVQGPAFKKEIPGVEDFVRVYENSFVLKNGAQSFTQTATWVDEGFFTVFSFPLLHGNPGTALGDSHSVVLTNDMAVKYFGTTNAMGKIVELEINKHFESFVVTGIAKRCPENSSIKFDMLLPFSYYATLSDNDKGEWQLLNYATYLLIKPGTDVQTISNKMNRVYKTYAAQTIADDAKRGSTYKFIWGLQPFLQMHLDTTVTNEGSIKDDSEPIYSYILTAIAFFILVTACINFINLTVARSMARSKEIGLRKVVGGTRAQLIGQFLGESFVICCIAFMLAILIAQMALPVFNQLANKRLNLSYLVDVKLVASFTALLLVTGLAAGFYPALVLSGFHPVETLRGKISKGGKNYLSRALVVFQFALAAFLIIGTLFIYYQYNYLTSAPLGYNDKNLLVVNANGQEDNQNLLNIFKTEFSALPGVQSVAQKMNGRWGTGAKAGGKDLDIDYDAIDEDYLSTMQIPLLQGRNFSKNYPSDSSQSVIINETFAKEAGWESPIGKTIDFVNGKACKLTVIGMVKDYHFKSMKASIGPKMFTINPKLGFGRFVIRLKPGNQQATLQAIEKIYRKYVPWHPIEYYFQDEANNKSYEAEDKWKQIISYSAILTVFISCTGLFALTMLSIRKRTKEIGVRKVLGASATSLVQLVSKDFLKLVVLAFAIAAPAAWYFVNKWLQGYAYRIQLSWQVFALAGGAIIVIAFATISLQAIKAAMANPVKSLRTE